MKNTKKKQREKKKKWTEWQRSQTKPNSILSFLSIWAMNVCANKMNYKSWRDGNTMTKKTEDMLASQCARARVLNSLNSSSTCDFFLLMKIPIKVNYLTPLFCSTVHNLQQWRAHCVCVSVLVCTSVHILTSMQAIATFMRIYCSFIVLTSLAQKLHEHFSAFA